MQQQQQQQKMPKGKKNGTPVVNSSDDDYWEEENRGTVDSWREGYDVDHSSSADDAFDGIVAKQLNEKKAKNAAFKEESRAASDRFELDDDGFTKLKGKKESEKEGNQQQQQQQQQEEDASKKKKKKEQQQHKGDLNGKQKSRDPLAGIDDPFDFFAQAQLQKVEKKASEQRAEHQRKLRRERASLPTHKQPAKQSKAEKNQKLSNITRLVFGNPNKEQKKKKSTSSEATNVQAAVERQFPPDTLEEVAKSLSEKDLEASIKKAETSYEKNPVFQLKDVAGWLEIQFSHINAKQVNTDENIKLFSDSFVKRMEKWLKTFDNKILIEVCLGALEEIYNDVGVEKAPGKHVGLKLFLQYTIRVQTKSVSDALIAHSDRFSFSGASYQNLTMLLDQIREHNFYVGLKTLTSISLLRIMSKKMKEKDEKEVIHLLNTQLENEKVKNYSGSASSSTLVEPNLFVNFQKFAYENGRDHILALYKKLIPISVFWADRSPSQFFAQELSVLKSPKLSQDYKDDLLSILSKSLENDEKCVDLWIKSIPTHIKESTILLSYINQHEGLHKVKGSDKLVQSLNKILENSSKNEQLQELEKEVSSLVSESSIFGTLLRLIFFLLVLLVIVAVGTVLYCGKGGNEGNLFCSANAKWTNFFTKVLQDRK